MPSKNHALPQVISLFLTCPGQDCNLGSGERQQVVRGNTFDNQSSGQVLNTNSDTYFPFKGSRFSCQSHYYFVIIIERDMQIILHIFDGI